GPALGGVGAGHGELVDEHAGGGGDRGGEADGLRRARGLRDERLVERLEASEAAEERARLRDERFRRLVAVRVAERQLGGEEGELRARERGAGGVGLRVAGPAREQHGREERGVRVLAVAGRDGVRLEQVVRCLVLAGLVGLGGQALERGEHAAAGARPEQALELSEVEAAQRREEPVAGVESPAEAPGTALLLVTAQPL